MEEKKERSWFLWMYIFTIIVSQVIFVHGSCPIETNTMIQKNTSHYKNNYMNQNTKITSDFLPRDCLWIMLPEWQLMQRALIAF